jgi:Tfp pilus assembly protein PilN
MKLQFNLLPDVKQDYLKTKRTKRTVITASIVASCIALFILLFAVITVYLINKRQLSVADGNIKKYSQQLQSVPNLDKILTIQNQLKSIGSLHQAKHKLSRIYTFLPMITPAHVCVSQMTIDTTANNISIQGSTDSQKSINTFVDTLKYTKYKIDGKSTGSFAFPGVTEAQFGINSPGNANSSSTKCQGSQAPAGYQLQVKFDPVLFANASNVTLDVPQGLVTTRSVLDDPSNIFNGDPKSASTQPAGSTGNTNSNTGGQ